MLQALQLLLHALQLALHLLLLLLLLLQLWRYLLQAAVWHWRKLQLLLRQHMSLLALRRLLCWLLAVLLLLPAQRALQLLCPLPLVLLLTLLLWQWQHLLALVLAWQHQLLQQQLLQLLLGLQWQLLLPSLVACLMACKRPCLGRQSLLWWPRWLRWLRWTVRGGGYGGGGETGQLPFDVSPWPPAWLSCGPGTCDGYCPNLSSPGGRHNWCGC